MNWIFLVAGVLLLFMGSASADPLHILPDPPGLGAGGPLKQLETLVSGDSALAASLATAVPSIQDGNGQKCWRAAASFGAAVKAHPVPLTLQAMTDIEGFRIVTIAAEQLCAEPACTQVFAELANGVAQMGVGLPVTALSAICAKVPHIAIVAPSPSPVSPP